MENKGCDCRANDTALVEKITENLARQEYIPLISRFFKVIGDETRLKIMMVLSEDEVSVNDIAVALNMTKSAISHQLKLLKAEGHIRSEKRGKQIYYTLDDLHVVEILNKASEHIGHRQD